MHTRNLSILDKLAARRDVWRRRALDEASDRRELARRNESLRRALECTARDLASVRVVATCAADEASDLRRQVAGLRAALSEAAAAANRWKRRAGALRPGADGDAAAEVAGREYLELVVLRAASREVAARLAAAAGWARRWKGAARRARARGGR